LRTVDGSDSATSFLTEWLRTHQQRCILVQSRMRDLADLFLNPMPAQGGQRGRRGCESGEEGCLVRHKRQFFFGLGLLVGVGIAALGSYLFSSGGLLSLSVGMSTGPSDETIHILQDHEKRSTYNEAALNRTEIALAALAKKVETLSTGVSVLEEVAAVQQSMDELFRESDRLARGIEEISHLRFSSDLVAPSKLRVAMLHIKERMLTRMMEILPTQGHEFYELDVSFLYFQENSTLRVFVHVPAQFQNSQLELFEYVPSPLPVSQDTYFLPNPREEILAVDRVSGTLYRTMTQGQLAMCHRAGAFHYCPGQNFFQKDVSHSCLANLFFNRIEAATKTCQFLPMRPSDDFLVQLAANQFLLYQSLSAPINLQCGTGSLIEGEYLEGINKLTIPPGCMVSTPKFNLYGQVDITAQDDFLSPHLVPDVNLTAFLPAHLQDAELSALINEISLIGSHKGVKVTDLVSRLLAARHTSYLRYTVGAIGTVLLCAILFGCLYYLLFSKRCSPCPRSRNVSFSRNRSSRPGSYNLSAAETEMKSLGSDDQGPPAIRQEAQVLYRQPTPSAPATAELYPAVTVHSPPSYAATGKRGRVLQSDP
jgi:hypothetical protein